MWLGLAALNEKHEGPHQSEGLRRATAAAIAFQTQAASTSCCQRFWGMSGPVDIRARVSLVSPSVLACSWPSSKRPTRARPS